MSTRLLTDQQIRSLLLTTSLPYPSEGKLINPFVPEQVRNDPATEAKRISYGLSSMGYDLRLSPSGLRVFSPVNAEVIDPKCFDTNALVTVYPGCEYQEQETHDFYLLPPHSYALGATVETFCLPDNVLGLCIGKSTYARCGLIVNTTPLEPGWRGTLTLELANTTSLPLRLYANEGIAQVLFFETAIRPNVTYADRVGKYQDQGTEAVMARV